jgi:cation diffusion facilitator CzcD-associated flavoprotein CzcO
MFGEISIPELAGLEDFQGHRFHSARWDHDHDLVGKHVR